MTVNDTHADTIREALAERWRVRKDSMGHFESMLDDTTQALTALDALVAERHRERTRADRAEAALRHARDAISSPTQPYQFSPPQDIYDTPMMSKALREIDAALSAGSGRSV